MEAEQSIAYGTVQAPRIQKKSNHGFVFKILFLIIIVIIGIVGGTVALLRSPQYQFKEVRVYGTNTFSNQDIISFTRDYWSGNYFGSIPRTNTILFSKKRFEASLMKQFPIIKVGYVTLPSPDILEINIQERNPVITWCFADDSCGFVDEYGVLYARAPRFSDGVYPIFKSELNDPTYKKFGTVVVDPVTMYRFVNLFQSLQSDEISLTSTFLYQNGDIAFSIDKLFGMYTGSNAKLLGTIGQDDPLFSRDMITGLSNESFKKQFSLSPKDLEYIDMRFPGKIFYKFSGQSGPLENKMDN